MDYKRLIDDLVFFIEQRLMGFDGGVLGLSGGIDSAVVLALLARSSKKAHAMMMPSLSSDPKALEDAQKLCLKLNVTSNTIRINYALNSLLNASQNPDISNLRRANFQARIRMSLLYDYSGANNLLVVGTTNKSELMLGYSTIHGDLASAFNPIGGLFKTQIYALARALKLPRSFLMRAPSADLWPGQSDEKELGFSYADIDKLLAFYERRRDEKECLKHFDSNLCKMVFKRMKKNAFKHELPVIYEPKLI